MIYYSKRNKEVIEIRDNIGGGALTETTLLVLLALRKPNHGYGIKQYIKNVTNGRVELGAGTLYGAISALEKKSWIEKDNITEGKKTYCLTDDGKEAIKKEVKRMKQVLMLAEEENE